MLWYERNESLYTRLLFCKQHALSSFSFSFYLYEDDDIVLWIFYPRHCTRLISAMNRMMVAMVTSYLDRFDCCRKINKIKYRGHDEANRNVEILTNVSWTAKQPDKAIWMVEGCRKFACSCIFIDLVIWNDDKDVEVVWWLILRFRGF